jgi:hypothetical protein
MKKLSRLILITLWFAPLAAESRYAEPPMPKYRVEAEGFDASARDIKAVCDSTGRELWRHFPGYELEPLVLVRGKSGPIVLHQRNDRGEIVMRLDTGGTFWCQYAYQFAHEFCHILCGYREGGKCNKWFEETLCETASLFTMRAMVKAWEDDPPYGHWKSFRHSIRQYVDDVITKRSKVMEIYKDGLGGFYRAHRAELAREPCDRELNGAMSLVLLRLLEEKPEHWEAVRWLNHTHGPRGETFQRYLLRWHDAVPERHRSFVRRVAELYGIGIAPRK